MHFPFPLIVHDQRNVPGNASIKSPWNRTQPVHIGETSVPASPLCGASIATMSAHRRMRIERRDPLIASLPRSVTISESPFYTLCPESSRDGGPAGDRRVVAPNLHI